MQVLLARRVLVLCMVVVFVVSVGGSALALEPGTMFTDASDWDEEFFANAAYWLGHAGVFVGDQDGNLMPDNQLTRAEMAVILSRITGLEDAAKEFMDEPTGWADDADIPAWARGYMVLAGQAQDGWFIGYEDNTVRARGTLTWAEISILLARVTGNEHLAEGAWPASAMTAGEAIGLYEGLPAVPGPATPVLRGSMVVATWAAMRAGTHREDTDEWDRDNTLLAANFPATAEAYAEYLDRPEFVISSNTPTFPNQNVVISFTNNTEAPIILDEMAILFEGGSDEDTWTLEETTIGAGRTVTILTFEPGPPHSWRNFYFDSERPISVSLFVDGERILMTELIHVIDAQVDEENSTAVFKQDHEDGTATFTVTALNAAGDPVSGIPLGGFVVTDLDWEPETAEGPPDFGTVVSVTETAPGVYDVVWAQEDGTHMVNFRLVNLMIAGGIEAVVSGN